MWPKRIVKVSYRGPTDTKGARWIVTSDGYSRKVYPREYERNHADDAYQAGIRYMREQGIKFQAVEQGEYKHEYYLVITRAV